MPASTVASVQGCPTIAASAWAARLGVAAMPPKAMRASATRPPSSAQLERRHHGRDVLVEALGDLVGAVARAGRGPGHGDALDELAGPAVLLAVGDEEVLERQAADARSPRRSMQRGAERDQRRVGVADRRAVGDVAADRAGVADLHRARTGATTRPDRGRAGPGRSWRRCRLTPAPITTPPAVSSIRCSSFTRPR